MEITLGEQDGVQVIALEGKIMGGPEDTRITDIIAKFIEQGQINVVLDLSKVTWMNSWGLGICLSGLTRLRNRGGDLRLTGIPVVVKSLMEKCRILHLFQSYATREEALKSFH
jgi:anti-sigma B factor antagonist